MTKRTLLAVFSLIACSALVDTADAGRLPLTQYRSANDLVTVACPTDKQQACFDKAQYECSGTKEQCRAQYLQCIRACGG